MDRPSLIVLPFIAVILLIASIAAATEISVAGIVYSGQKDRCLCVLKSIEVFDLTYDPNSNKKIDETDEYGLFLVNVNPTDEGYMLELRDPKGIYGNQSIIGDPTPHKQKESREMDSRDAAKEWKDDVARKKIGEQVNRFFYIQKSFPTKKNWHEAIRRLAIQNLSFIEKNLRPDVLKIVSHELDMAKETISK